MNIHMDDKENMPYIDDIYFSNSGYLLLLCKVTRKWLWGFFCVCEIDVKVQEFGLPLSVYCMQYVFLQCGKFSAIHSLEILNWDITF